MKQKLKLVLGAIFIIQAAVIGLFAIDLAASGNYSNSKYTAYFFPNKDNLLGILRCTHDYREPGDLLQYLDVYKPPTNCQVEPLIVFSSVLLGALGIVWFYQSLAKGKKK